MYESVLRSLDNKQEILDTDTALVHGYTVHKSIMA